MNFSDYLEARIINHYFRNAASTTPGTVYIALFTGAAAAALEANNPTTEVADGAYVRKAVTMKAPANGVTKNEAVNFDAATAGWGTITHFAIVDHVSAEDWGTDVNVLMWGALTAEKTVNNGDIFSFPEDSITLTVA